MMIFSLDYQECVCVCVCVCVCYLPSEGPTGAFDGTLPLLLRHCLTLGFVPAVCFPVWDLQASWSQVLGVSFSCSVLCLCSLSLQVVSWFLPFLCHFHQQAFPLCLLSFSSFGPLCIGAGNFTCIHLSLRRSCAVWPVSFIFPSVSRLSS